jgi:hypothetical protein
MSTYCAHQRVTNFGHPVNGGLGGYCRGLVPRVLLVTGYGSNFLIRVVPSSGKWQGGQMAHTRYRPTTPG